MSNDMLDITIFTEINKPQAKQSPLLQPHNRWLQDHAARLERRLELGSFLSDEAEAWLHKTSQPHRFTFWLECLSIADVNGVVELSQMHSLKHFDTGRKKRYLFKQLEAHGLALRLSNDTVQVIA